MRGAVGLGSVLLALACGGLGPTGHALDASDHAVLVEVGELVAVFPTVVVDPAKQTWSKSHSFGSWDLEYEYETDDFYLSTLVFVEDDPAEASTTMWALGLAPGMLDAYDVQFEASADLCSLGEERKCGLLRKDGLPVGNLCTLRQGGAVMMFVLVGGYVEGPGELDAVLGGPVAALNGYSPKSSPLPK
jgi:hypothetical protein